MPKRTCLPSFGRSVTQGPAGRCKFGPAGPNNPEHAVLKNHSSAKIPGFRRPEMWMLLWFWATHWRAWTWFAFRPPSTTSIIGSEVAKLPSYLRMVERAENRNRLRAAFAKDWNQAFPTRPCLLRTSATVEALVECGTEHCLPKSRPYRLQRTVFNRIDRLSAY